MRQISCKFTAADLGLLADYLEKECRCKLYNKDASTKEDIFSDRFREMLTGVESTFYIWNTDCESDGAFVTSSPYHERDGYMIDMLHNTYPLIELQLLGAPGVFETYVCRFVLDDYLAHRRPDVVSFYNKLTRWIRRNGKQDKESQCSWIYYLPAAWESK